MKQITLAEFLKKERLSLGLLQREFAEKLRISRFYYICLENGKYKNPRIDLVKRIAEQTGRPITFINNLLRSK